MADLIDRQALLKEICNSCDGWCDNTNCDCVNCKSKHRCDAVCAIADAHAIDAVVLPCNVGDEIYRIVKPGGGCKPFIPTLPDKVEQFGICYRNVMGGHSLIPLDEFGKTVFLTREEAVAAMRKKNQPTPCKHGLCRHLNEIGEDEVYCEVNARWMNVTLGDCLGNCESETEG